MTHLQVILILCQSVFTLNYINCAQPLLDENAYNFFRQEIIKSAYNSTEFIVNSATIKSAQQQENSVHVTSTVGVDCELKDELCPISKQLNCYTSFTYSENEGYSLDSYNFNCTPLIIPEFANCQAGQPGCPFDLNVNARGVSTFTNAALAHLRHERMEDYNLIQTLRLQRQVLETVRSSVKYYLTIEVARKQGGENQVCYVTFLEKPTLDGNTRHIISNNCTYNQEYTTVFTQTTDKPQEYHRNDQNNEIDVNYSVTKVEQVEQTKENPNYEQIAQSGNADEVFEGISASRVREIESQVLPITYFDKKQAIDGLLDVFNFDVEPKLKTSQQGKLDATANEELKPIIEPIIVPVRAVVAFHKPLTAPKIETVIIGVADSDTVQNTTEDEDEITQTREKRDLTSSKQLQPTTPDETILVENLSELAVNTLDNIDTDNHRRVVLKILGSKKSVSKGITYHLTLKVGISECMEDEETVDKTSKDLLQKMIPESAVEQKCRNTLLSDLTMICKVQVYVTERKTNPKVVKSQCQNLKRNGERNNRTGGRFRRAVFTGGLTPLDTTNSEFYDLVEDALKKLDELSDESNGFKIINVQNATKQLVAGLSYKITAEVGLADLSKTSSITPTTRLNAKLLDEPKSKVCVFNIWDRPWLTNGKETSISCDAETKISFRSKRSISKLGGYGDDHEIHLGLFYDFMQKYNKTYNSKIEHKRRFNIFKQNMKKIREFNNYELGTAKYGATMFTDLTRKEFEQYLGYNPNLANGNNLPLPEADIPEMNLPDSVDWRERGAVTEVKNQGQCGSCWAFSVTGNVEGQYYIKNKKLLEFSEQELVDCDKLDDGCGGGLMDNAYRSIEKMGGLETEKDYPYEAENDKCVLDKSKVRVQLKGAVNITSDEVGMAKWLAKNGPISIAINANAMQFYMGGVSHPWKVLCNPKQLDHGVLIVGYGTKTNKYFNKTMPYWIVKNSWGPRWGEQGYYRVFRGAGTCGVNQTPSSAILSDDY